MIIVCVFSVPVLVVITPIWSLPCCCSATHAAMAESGQPSKLQVRSCLTCSSRLSVFALINTLFATNVAIRYVILILFAMDVVLGLPTSTKLREAPAGASTKHVSMGKARPNLPLLLMFLPVCVG